MSACRENFVVGFWSRVVACGALGGALLAAAPTRAFDEAFKPIEGGVFDVDGGPIGYVIDPVGSEDLELDDVITAIDDSFRAWACVPGTKVRFENKGAGPRVLDLGDGQNTLFWDESGADCLMGPGTLGITLGTTSGVRSAADICFNGKDHTWGVGKDTDVQSIAMHEIGHFIGLDHPCDNDGDTSTCLPVTEAIMFPSWSGVPERAVLDSDIAGVTALYPLEEGDASGCEGPFRQGERCSCNDECVEGLVCVPDNEGDLRCGRRCSVAEADCGAGAVCVLDVPQDGQDALGVCVSIPDGRGPPGALCTVNAECESALCTASIKLRRSVCQAPCSSDDDCAGGTCFDDICLGGFSDEECPVAEDPGCGCDAQTPSSGVLSSMAALALLGLVRRRRRA